MAKDTLTTPAPTTGALYEAVEGLKEMATGAFNGLENDGDLIALRDELGEIRDRANAIQDAVIAFIAAINEYL